MLKYIVPHMCLQNYESWTLSRCSFELERRVQCTVIVPSISQKWRTDELICDPIWSSFQHIYIILSFSQNELRSEGINNCFAFAKCYRVIFGSFSRLHVWHERKRRRKTTKHNFFAVKAAILFLNTFVTTHRYQAFQKFTNSCLCFCLQKKSVFFICYTKLGLSWWENFTEMG